MAENKVKKKRILVCVNRDFVLYNFRVELLERLLEVGCDIYICLPDGPKVKLMIDMGCIHVPITIDKRGTNPIKDIGLIKAYRKIFKEVNPDMILLYTTKVCIYGGIVAGQLKIPYLENVSGLGTALENPGILQKLMIFLYRQACKKARCVFFQNDDNQKFFNEHHIYKGKQVRIPGSGVNVEKWKYLEYPSEESGIEFLFVARIIKEKGIDDYLYCAEEIKKKYPNTKFHICGPCDGNYGDILKDYEERGIIQYHGEVQDTAEYLKRVHCLIHPSYYSEGISNVCLEAAASGRPIITTNKPGCRETVLNHESGFLFDAKNQQLLIETVDHFCQISLRERMHMGIIGREYVCRNFNRMFVISRYMEEI